MVYSYIVAKKRGYGKERDFSFKYALVTTYKAIPALLMPIILLGGVLGGFFTPTEAAAVSVLYGLLVGFFVYRELTWQAVWDLLLITGYRTALVVIILASTTVVGYVLAIEQVPTTLSEAIMTMSDQVWLLLILVNIFLLIVGCFMDASAAILLIAPILAPAFEQVGVSPVHFGVMMTLNLMIGLLTPPVGGILYIISDIAKIPFDQYVRAVLPFLVPLLIALVIVTHVPWVTMWLPGLFGMGR